MTTVLEDKDAICDILARSCFYSDTCQFEKNANLFTEDCEWDGGAAGHQKGRANVMAFFKLGAEPKFRHCVSNIQITIDGDEAHAISYLQVLSIREPVPVIIFSGIYLDHLVRRDGRWLFKLRKVRADFAEARIL